MSDSARAWGLRLLALAISLAVWYSVSLSDRETLAETTIEQATVNYIVPREYVMLDPNPVRNARVRLRGSDKKIRQLNPYQVRLQVELPEAAKGAEVNVSLGPDDVQVPDDFEVISIEPNVIRVELDREVAQLVSVKPQLTGEPAAGARMAGEAEVYPNQVHVTGPESLVTQLDFVTTRPVNLDGHALPFEEQVAVVAPDDPLIQLQRPLRVLVRVPLEPPRTAGEDGDAPRGSRGREDS